MITYDPIHIEYDTNPDDELLSEETIKLHHKQPVYRPLIEISVDPGYELESVEPKYLIYLEALRERFILRRDEPLPFFDLKSAMYAIGNNLGKPISDFQITHGLRALWRAGYIRRLVRGKSTRSKKIGRGEYYGVHYILYPKDSLNE